MSPRNTNESLRRAKSLVKRIVPLACGLTVVVLFAVGIHAQSWSNETGSKVLIGALFGIPVLVQGVALVFLVTRVNWPYYFFNLVVTSICFGCCFWFWYQYFDTNASEQLLNRHSYETLAVILILLVAVGVMTYAIMRPSNDHVGGRFCDDLNTGVRDHPFWAIMFFFTLFVGVAYLFGFTLAFHDNYARKQSERVQKDKSDSDSRPALRMINFKSIDDFAEAEQDSTKASGPVPAVSPSPTPNDTMPRLSFYFQPGEALLKTSISETCKEESPPRRTWKGTSDPERFNDCNLRALARRIQEQTVEGRRVRVSLVGHGDSKPIGGHYLSNYELSEARARQVKSEILSRFPEKEDWHNVEWSIVPASNEEIKEIESGLVDKDLFTPKELADNFTQDEIAKSISPKQLLDKFTRAYLSNKLKVNMTAKTLADENRVVLASIQPVPKHVTALQMKELREATAKPLRLIDYMYFSIYTITTTGYGDIVPTTAYGKFVTSVANFCEVLFLVVFFNALISLKGKGPDDRSSGKATG